MPGESTYGQARMIPREGVRTEDKQKERACLTVAAASFILLIISIVVLFVSDFGHGEVLAGLMLLSLLVWVGALLASVAYSEDGWDVQGSTWEWMLAAFLSPALTFFMYANAKEKERGEVIDLNDRERLAKL